MVHNQEKLIAVANKISWNADLLLRSKNWWKLRSITKVSSDIWSGPYADQYEQIRKDALGSKDEEAILSLGHTLKALARLDEKE